MEINLVTGATAFEAAKNTIKKIDTKDFEYQNLVVVPDAFSMQAESLIFDTLDIKSTFNIEIVGISRLANKILQDNCIECKRISGLEEVFCIYQAVQSVKEQFVYFKSSGIEFCQRILQIIKQFKGSKISPEQIKTTGYENLDAKMHDIKLIYEKYQSLLQDKFDLSGLLEFFLEKTQKQIDLSKTNLYVVNFDSFSAEISSFLCQLAGKVNKMVIGMAKPISQNNAYIFEDDILKKTTKFAKEYGLTINVESQPTHYQGDALNLVSNLFGLKVDSGSSDDYMFHILAKSSQEEVEFAAKYIKYAVRRGKKFNDFAIAVANEKYYQKIKDVFSSYGIATYCDDALPLSKTVIGRFLQKILQTAKQGFDKECFKFFASSTLLGREDEILKQIDFYNVTETAEFVDRFPKYKQLVLQIEMLKCATNVRQYADILVNIIESIKAGHQNLLEKLEGEKFYKKYSENLQAVELLQKVLEKLCEIAGQEKIDIYNFDNIFALALNSVKVETIPTFIDAVFVGKATESYFEDVDTLFVLGATSSSLPAMQGDTSIIDDDDIAKLRLNFVLEPEIRVLNRRKRLKIFELLPHAQNRLVVCTPVNEDGGQAEPSLFVKDLLTLFGGNTLRLSAFDESDIPIFSNEEELDKLLFQIGCQENLLPYFTKSQDKISKKYISSVKATISEELPVENKINALHTSLLANKKTISASQLEAYFNCPFKHFLSYIMQIKRKDSIEPTKLVFGNLMHEILKIFVSENGDLKNVDDKKVDDFLKQNLLKIAQKHYDEKILKRQYFVRLLQKESKIILKNAIKEQLYSEFKPYLFEESVLFDIAPKLKLKGFVDRVDVCGDDFRIIDYKTGETGTIKTELFYGTKLQLFLYSLAMENKLGKTCVGAFYFDCQTKFEKQNKSSKLLSGMTVMDNDTVIKMDNRLKEQKFRSDVLGTTHKKTDTEDEFAFCDGAVFVENFKDYMQYAKQISQTAIKEMKEGYIQIKPFKGACARCPYNSICRHCETDGSRTQLKAKKTEQ